MYNISTNITVILKKLYPDIAFQESMSDNIDSVATHLDDVIQAYRLDRERIFIELWWSGNEYLQTIGTYLLPEIILYPGRQSFNIMNETIKHLHDPKLTELLALSFAKIIKNDLGGWVEYISSLTGHSNPMVQCFISQTLVHLARNTADNAPLILAIIERLMHTGNKIVQDCVSWALIQLSLQWQNNIRSFINSNSQSGDINTIRIICKSAMGFGPWIIPILNNLVNAPDQEIRFTVKKTLTLVNQIEYSLTSLNKAQYG